MSIQHFYSQTVADGTATSVVRPSDWNSVHNQILNIGGNTAGTSQISGADIVWAGGNNVTLSANGSTVTIVGPNTVAQTVQTQPSGNIVGAGFTSTTTAGAAVVATQNSNGLSMAVPNFLTTAAQSNHSHNFATTTTNGNVIVVGTTNSAGATVGVPAFITTYVNDLTSGRAGTGTSYAGTGINATIALNTNGLALSLAEAVATDSWFATGANTIAGTNTSGTFTNDGYVVSGAGGVSVGVSSNTLVISGPTGGGGTINQTGPNIAVAGSTVTSGDVYFSNSPTVTFGMNGSTITASAAGGGGGGGVTIGKWEPFYPAGTTTSAPGQNSVYLQKLRPDNNVSFSYIERRMSNSAVSTAVAATAGNTIDYGLYSRGTGTNSTRMELMGSSQMQMNVSMSSSSASWLIAQGGTTNTFSSATTTPASLFTGLKHLYMPYTGTLSAGQEYWFAQRVSTSGSSQGLRLGFWEQTVINNLTVGKIYGTTVSASNASYVGDFNQGVLSATSAAFPTTLADSQLTNAVSQARMYLQFDDGV